MDIKKAVPTDYKRMILFMNKVFNLRFEKLVPKLYDNHPELAKWHRIVEENGKIIAAIATVPVHFRLGESEIRGCGIGMVSVSKSCRGKGIMSAMMESSITDAITDHDADIMFLTGYRQRYEYFGFVPSGAMHTFSVCDNNIAHRKNKGAYTLLPLEKNLEYLDKMVALHESRPYHWQRDKAYFYDIITSWHYQVKIILKEKTFVGYVILHRNLRVCEELMLIDGADIIDTVCGIATATKKNNLTLHIPHYEKKQVSALLGFAERYLIEENCSIKIINHTRLIRNLLQDSFDNTPQNMPIFDGTIVLKIENKVISITVKNRTCEVIETTYDKSKNIAFDIEFTESEAAIALCSYNGAYISHPLLRAWGIGGISLPHVDNV